MTKKNLDTFGTQTVNVSCAMRIRVGRFVEMFQYCYFNYYNVHY